jgi:DNA-binding transcriptional ArsR family regulator
MGTSIPLDMLATGMLGFGHPIRVQALVLLEAETSPRDLAEQINAPLGVVSYHVRMLREYGLVEQTRTEPRRGALAHYYQRTEFADTLIGHLNGLLKVPARKRGRQGQARRDVLSEWLSAVA